MNQTDMRLGIVVGLFLLSTVAAGEMVLLGGFDSNEGGVFQDASALGVVRVTMSGNNASRDYEGYTGGLRGSFGDSPLPSTTNFAENQMFGDLPDFVIMVENTSASNSVELSRLNWVSCRAHEKSETIYMVSASGTIAADDVISGSLGEGDDTWRAFDVDLSPILTSRELAPGESGFFTVARTGQTGARSFMVDNLAVSGMLTSEVPHEPQGLASFDSGYTLMKVRSGILSGESVIVGASYEGTILAMDYSGTVLWTNALTGYMVRDLWCDDLNGDGTDEVLAAVSDGTVHCLNMADGTSFWTQPFQPNDAPMNAVCSIRGSNETYVVCGGFDLNLYWLDANGTVLKTVESSTYSDLKPWGDGTDYMGRSIGNAHSINFLRPLPQSDQTDHLVLDGSQIKLTSHIWEFEPLGSAPLKMMSNQLSYSSGSFEVADPDGDENYSIYVGRSGFDIKVAEMTPATGFATNYYEKFVVPQQTYRTSHLTWIPSEDSYKNFILCGVQILLLDPSFDSSQAERIRMPYAFNDLWRDPVTGRILLASSQDGGSAVHVIDPSVSTWKQEVESMKPPGKIQTILSNHATIRAQHQSFVRPVWERAPDEILCVGGETELAEQLAASAGTPEFLGSAYSTHVQNTDWKSNVTISTVTPSVDPANEPHLWSTDDRFTYDQTRQEILDNYIQPAINENEHGFQFRGGHGNGPYYYQPETLLMAIDRMYADDPDKRMVINWAELQSTSDDMAYPLARLLLPVAERFNLYGNGLLSFNNKHLFYSTTIHKPVWSDFISGKLKNSFRPSLEESTSKTPELSLSARLGLWASGCVDGWGARTTRDNVAFDRARQYGGQVIANHFLRHMIYRYACGADYSACHYTNLDHQGLAGELIASGALFVPRREEIISFNPVHISIRSEMDPRYIGANDIPKWTTYYDEAEQAANPMVFGRLEGCWMAGKNTDFDFSRYAMGVKERRQNFLPPTPNGMVLTTPVENGVFASTADYRNRLRDNLHPLYENIVKEYITDGRNYISSDGSITNAANSSYFQTVTNAIHSGALCLPVTVSGNVAWVCAQTDAYHLRLTLIDSGYLNPKARVAKVQFNTVIPAVLTDVLSGETLPFSGVTADINVPLGMFRFIDIKLSESFFPPPSTWDAFVQSNQLDGTPDSDSDDDGLSDFMEFAIGNNPWVKDATANQPRLVLDSASNQARYAYQGLHSANLSIRYQPEWTEDLLAGLWRTDWGPSTITTNESGNYSQFNYSLTTSGKNNAFFRLKIINE